MPAAPWTIYRLGARIGAVDGLLPRAGAARATFDRLQELTSAVAVADLDGSTTAIGAASADGRFVARLALGLLRRGWPTLSSPAVEAAIVAGAVPGGGLRAEPVGRAGEIGWRLEAEEPGAGDERAASVATTLATADPRLAPEPPEIGPNWRPPDSAIAIEWDSASERRFYQGELSRLLGPALGLVELQRPVDTMATKETRPETGPGGSMPWRRADFVLEVPGFDGPVRLNIELDGPHHAEPHQQALDIARDAALREAGWDVIRVPVAALDDPLHPKLVALRGAVQTICEADPAVRALIEGRRLELGNPVAVEALRLLLTPHAVARVQLGVILALLDGTLRLDMESWEIVVIEREAPCAEAALLDLLQTLRHLCRLYGVPFDVERVRLRVAAAHLAAFPPLPMTAFPDEARRLVAAEPLAAAGAPADVADAVLDVAVLARPTQVYPTDPTADLGVVGRAHYALRTSHRAAGAATPEWDAPRPVTPEQAGQQAPDPAAGSGAAGDAVVETASLPLVGTAPPAPRGPLRYFLQALFRKRDFREGQLEIIDRALARKDVIGLLPTGAGKSICYQLPALLSPGQTLVVDPIKSLMQDQVDNLAAAGIHDAVAINSDQTPEQRRAAEAAFGRGEFRFVFISPERLQIQRFRDHVKAAGQARPTAFVVVDEAHCVSEWGHDFRIAYLNLSRLSRELCVYAGLEPPIVALTGTASRAVLVDVQRELRIDDPEAIVSPASFDRPELRFAIEPVAWSKLPALREWITQRLPKHLGIPEEELGSGHHGGIVFCPHVYGAYGAYPLHQRMQQALDAETGNGTTRVGFYSGSVPKHLRRSGVTNVEFAARKAETQQRFKRDEIAVLVATKAFGMGIDKPNIRYTIHYGMAESVEAFAQEAGRAGRDRRPAVCVVLFSDTKRDQPPERDPLALGIEVEEARKRIEEQEHKDDADRVLWLHGRSYAGAEAEATAIRGFYRLFVQPRFAVPGTPDTAIASIPDAMVMARLGQGGWLPALPEPPTGQDERPDKPPEIDFQRIVYRLSLLGIVDDYTIEYGSPTGDGDKLKGTYAVTLRRPEERTVHDRLFAYVGRYRFSNGAADVHARFVAAPHGDPIERAIEALCWFTYEEIEKQRRTDIHTMRQVLRESLAEPDPGEALRRQLNDLLSASHFTQGIDDLRGAGDDLATGDGGLPARLDHANALLAMVEGPNDADQLVGQARRYRSADPDNPALLALVGLGLAHNPRRNPDDAAESLGAALTQLARHHDDVAVDRAAGWMVETLANPIVPLGEQTTWALLARERAAGGERVARVAFRRVASPRLKRACALPFLRAIDAAVGDLLAHHLGAPTGTGTGEGGRSDG